MCCMSEFGLRQDLWGQYLLVCSVCLSSAISSLSMSHAAIGTCRGRLGAVKSWLRLEWRGEPGESVWVCCA
jgi:hypothetical protein